MAVPTTILGERSGSRGGGNLGEGGGLSSRVAGEDALGEDRARMERTREVLLIL